MTARATRWQKLQALGLPYTLRFKLWAPFLGRMRGAAVGLQLTEVGHGLRVHGSVLVQRDRGSRICLGSNCDIQSAVSLRSIRSHALAPGAALSIGNDCLIKQDSMLLAKSGRIRIGNRCSVGRYSEIACEDVEINIGNDVRIAAYVWIGTGNHIFRDADVPIIEQGIEQHSVTIEDDVWLGTKVVVLPGVTIGRGSVVAASAVVTRDIPPFSVAGGIPARVLKGREKGP